MQRICSSLARNGFQVLLVGRKLGTSKPLQRQLYRQKRLYCFFTKGFAFYAEYNLRLLFYLLFCRRAIICAIDLDTILPCLFVAGMRRLPRVYDAHELFTEQKEIVTRPTVYRVWKAIEKFAVPRFKNGYTVNGFIAGELNRRYAVNYGMVRNLPLYNALPQVTISEPPIILYQGAVNHGRSFETLIPAMRYVNARLDIYGHGNFYTQAQQLITQHQLQYKVFLKGYVEPALLKQITAQAAIAVMLFEKTGLNQYYSLANRFFDYIMAAVPQLCVNYPEYKAINDVYGIGYMIDDTDTETIAAALNKMLADTVLYNSLKANCLKAREVLRWEEEEKKLLAFYNQLVAEKKEQYV